MAEDSQLGNSEFTARPYQLEIFEEARKKDVIVCLGTGTGKTFISVMLIKDLAHQISGTLEEGGLDINLSLHLHCLFFVWRTVRYLGNSMLNFKHYHFLASI